VRYIVGLSGGKDSTALALRLAEVEPRDYEYICTPTGDELPEMKAWWARLELLLGKPLIRITNSKTGDLNNLIQIMGALPNHRQRWCTRMLKIEPTIAWCVKNGPVQLYVGLRADEDEREGIYGDLVQSDFPYRRWGWGIKEVWEYLESRGLADCVPVRTDCARCYAQKLSEWFRLWRDKPDIYWEAAAQEVWWGHTFRSPSRDTWPAGLVDLAREFSSGRKIRGGVEPSRACRVCQL
jgi:Phosphoadenosine phosphosulfate reductase family